MIGVSDPFEHDDRQRHPGEGRNRSQQLEYREMYSLNVLRPSKEQPQWHSGCGGQHEGNQNPAQLTQMCW